MPGVAHTTLAAEVEEDEEEASFGYLFVFCLPQWLSGEVIRGGPIANEDVEDDEDTDNDENGTVEE